MATPVIKPKKTRVGQVVCLSGVGVVAWFFLKNIEDMDLKKGVSRDEFQYLSLT